jgi:hypothetical protein
MGLRSRFLTLPSLALLVSCAAPFAVTQRLDLLGGPAPLEAATQTIVITPQTRWVNVTGGDTVKFIVDDKAFAWNFTVESSVSSFSLNQVAPAGFLSREVVAYVAPDPLYIGGGNGDGQGLAP